MTDESKGAQQLGLSIDIREYFLLYWHWIWLIVGIGFIVGLATYYISTQTTSIYSASTLLLVSEPPASRMIDTSQSSIVPSGYMAQTYSQMLTNLPVLQDVVDRLKIQISPLKLKSQISINLIQETQLIRVTVKDTDPARAANIANMLGTVFAERIQNLQDLRFAQSKDNLSKQLTEMETQLQEVATQLISAVDQEEKDRLTTRQTQYRQIYATLVSSFEQLRMAEAQAVTIVVQVDPAVVANTPVNPVEPQYIVLAALIGMLLTAGVLTVVNLLDDSVRDPESLVNLLNLPILGVISHYKTAESTLIVRDDPQSTVAEAYRILRTNVQYANRPKHTILVTSPTPTTGKTTVTANLAVAFSRQGMRTALVDADMRWPRLHQSINGHNRTGLSNCYDQTDLNLDGILQQAVQKDLSLLTAGPVPRDPAEMLASKRTAQIIAVLEMQNDIVLIDSPAFLTVTDAAVLAPLVDGILIVVRAGRTKLNAVRRMAEALDRQGKKLLGFVINDVNFKDARYRYYFRNYYFGEHQKKQENKRNRFSKKNLPFAEDKKATIN